MRPTEIFDEWEHGFSWRPVGEGPMQRTSHALVDNKRVWIIDPIDTEGIDDHLNKLGEVVGVVQLLDRHARHTRRFAERFGVPIYVSPGKSFRYRDLEESSQKVEELGAKLPGTKIECIQLHRVSNVWLETALWWPAQSTLIVSESIGTHEFSTAPGEDLGVHPTVRMVPPKALKKLTPQRIQVGHGCAITSDAKAILDAAIENSRRNIPRYLAAFPRQVWRWRGTHDNGGDSC